MSSSLIYSPSSSERQYILHHQVRYVLAPLIWEGFDGSEGSDRAALDKTDIPMLEEAMRTTTYGDDVKKSIQRLINSIERNNAVLIWLER